MSLLMPMLLALAACGGGGGGGSGDSTNPSTTPTTPSGASPDILLPREAVAGLHVSLVSALGEGTTATTFDWDLGDGTRSSLPAPAHAYLRPGSYEVTLTVTQAGTAQRPSRASLLVTGLQSPKVMCEGLGRGTFCKTGSDPVKRQRVFSLSRIQGSALASGDMVRLASDGALQREPAPAGFMTDTRFEPWFLDTQTGLAVAEFRVVRSTDGGANWSVVALPLDLSVEYPARLWTAADGTVAAEVYRKESFAQLPGYAVAGLISRDRGLTWSRLPHVLRGLSNAGTVWASRDAELGRSVDGGRSFSFIDALRDSLPSFDGTDTLFFNAGPASPLPGGLVRSSDEGRSFAAVRQTVPAAPAAGLEWAPFLSGGRHVWGMWRSASLAVGSVQYSDDYGQTWRRVELPPGAALRPGVSSVALHGDDHAPVADLFGDGGRRWLTVDGGLRWREIQLAVDAGVLAQARREADGSISTLYSSQQTYLTRDDGLSWTQVTGPAPFVLPHAAQPWLSADGRGFFVQGQDGYETVDGGAHWKKLASVSKPDQKLVASTVTSVQFTSAQAGWWWSDGRLHRSVDGGRTWSAHPLPAELTDRVIDLKFTSPADGFLLTQLCSGPAPVLASCTLRLHATRDGGNTWQRRAAPFDEGFQVRMDWADEQHGVVTLDASINGYEGIWITTDGGSTWQQRTADNSLVGAKVRFNNARLGWVMNRRDLYRTVDGGVNWTLVPLPEASYLFMEDVIFDAAGRGAIVATRFVSSPNLSGLERNIVYRSTDGGTSWATP